MTNREVFITILTEATGKSKAHVTVMIDLLIQAKPELANHLDRPAAPGIIDRLRQNKDGISQWLEDGRETVASGRGRYVKTQTVGDKELVYLDLGKTVDNR